MHTWILRTEVSSWKTLIKYLFEWWLKPQKPNVGGFYKNFQNKLCNKTESITSEIAQANSPNFKTFSKNHIFSCWNKILIKWLKPGSHNIFTLLFILFIYRGQAPYGILVPCLGMESCATCRQAWNLND